MTIFTYYNQEENDGKFTESKQSMGMGRTGPDVLPEYLAEERDHAIVEMDTRQRRAGRSTGKIGLASW